MPYSYKRKWTSRGKPRSYTKRPRYSRRRPRKVGFKRYIPSINKTPISYTREIPNNNLQITTGSNWMSWATTFSAGTLPNITEFSNLFDVYRIRRVTIKLRLVQPPEATNTPATSQFYPDVYVTVDHDDATIPPSVDSVLQYGKCKRGVLRPNRWFTYSFYPTTSIQLYRGPTTTGYAPMKNGAWLDLAYTDVPYYGLKGVISNEAAGVTTAALAVEYHTVYTIQFKNNR